MKSILKKTFIINYFILLTGLFLVEIIFKLISGGEIMEASTLRIFIGLNIFCVIVSFLMNFLRNNFIKKFLIGLMIFALATYSCAELGFYNFLGVYMSVQTSSQFGAVVDYISDFIASFKLQYFLTFIPFILYLPTAIFLNKGRRDKLSLKNSAIVLAVVFAVTIPFYAFTIVSKKFQDKFQIVTNANLFLTASNPTLTVKEYGTLGFVFLDFKAMLFPVTIEVDYSNSDPFGVDEEVLPEEEVVDLRRTFDDTKWNEVINSETNKTLNSLNKYFINRKITMKNEMTGLFENKNLIVIMIESANDILYDEKYFPNFNKLVQGGWSWENNYSPRNSCATMNNEFSGMTSLYSIYNTCTASKYKVNYYYESIFNLFNNKDYITFSEHNYTEAYYPRKTIHPNMGSGEYFSVQKLGIPYSNEYINWSNDDDAMKSILKIVDKKREENEHFMTWWTTVSSHQPYGVNSIQGGANFDMTKDTKYPKDVRRYMSKLKILDNALGLLLDGLEERGILEDTVIVLYGDHYPYGIKTSNLNKVLDYDTSEDLNAEQVPFVIYNAGTTDGTVFKEYTSYMNILPTLANLFNLDYDPRLYLGYDLFSSDARSLTVFADGSWKNEVGFYNASKNKIKYYGEEKYTPEQIAAINNDIAAKIDVSEKAIKNNYFTYLYKKLYGNGGNVQTTTKPTTTTTKPTTTTTKPTTTTTTVGVTTKPVTTTSSTTTTTTTTTTTKAQEDNNN